MRKLILVLAVGLAALFALNSQTGKAVDVSINGTRVSIATPVTGAKIYQAARTLTAKPNVTVKGSNGNLVPDDNTVMPANDSYTTHPPIASPYK
jgi:hypothetical protein